MFSDNLLEIIFSNIENIYEFHLDFLHCIQDEYEEKPRMGKIGEAFINNVSLLKSLKNSLLFKQCCSSVNDLSWKGMKSRNFTIDRLHVTP